MKLGAQSWSDSVLVLPETISAQGTHSINLEIHYDTLKINAAYLFP